MNAVREAWTDDRIDDLAHRMDTGFDRVDRDIREVRAEMRAGFATVDARFDSMNDAFNARFDSMNDSVNARFDSANDSVNARFDAVNSRFDAMTARLESLQRTMLRVGGGLAAVVLASILANHL
ncbi:MAG TPA: hypothetical protein VGO66_08255 [Solirubrobacterales bacterium]|jgi:hypothetical protein|nr:hypothetical protein [Solirubrobacterales bacterium]